MVNNISSKLTQNYIPSLPKDETKTQEAFKDLSLAMGGDGNSIKKIQLDNYIQKADSNSIKVEEPKISALKELQNNWNKVSNNKDSINFSNMANFTNFTPLLTTGSASTTTPAPASVTAAVHTEKSASSSTSSNFNLYNYLGEMTGASNSNGVTKTELTSYLKDLIVGDSADSDNSNEIALVTNLIADFDAISNSKNVITPESLAASKGFEA